MSKKEKVEAPNVIGVAEVIYESFHRGLQEQEKIVSYNPGKMDLKGISKGRHAGRVKVKWEFYVDLAEEEEEDDS